MTAVYRWTETRRRIKAENRRYSIWPALDLLPQDDTGNHPGPVGILAALLSAGSMYKHDSWRQWIHRRVARGGMSLDDADKVAVALGRHPTEIWPDWGQA